MVMELKQEPAILLSLEAVEKSLFEVSLHIPDLNSVTPVRYIMEPGVRQSTRIEAGEYDAAGGGMLKIQKVGLWIKVMEPCISF